MLCRRVIIRWSRFAEPIDKETATRGDVDEVHDHVEDPAGAYTTALKRFLKTGAPAPKGLKTIGRWHAAGSSRGFHLVEGSEAALAEINAEWADLLELEVVPVVEDDVAGAVAKKVYGKK